MPLIAIATEIILEGIVQDRVLAVLVLAVQDRVPARQEGRTGIAATMPMVPVVGVVPVVLPLMQLTLMSMVGPVVLCPHPPESWFGE